mgnify:CR=1 FL=1
MSDCADVAEVFVSESILEPVVDSNEATTDAFDALIDLVNTNIEHGAVQRSRARDSSCDKLAAFWNHFIPLCEYGIPRKLMCHSSDIGAFWNVLVADCEFGIPSSIMMHDSGLHEFDPRPECSDHDWNCEVQAMLSECSPQQITDFLSYSPIRYSFHRFQMCNSLHVLPSGMSQTSSAPDAVFSEQTM